MKIIDIFQIFDDLFIWMIGYGNEGVWINEGYLFIKNIKKNIECKLVRIIYYNYWLLFILLL